MARSVFMLDGRQSQRDDAPADPALFVQRHPIRTVASNRAHARAPSRPTTTRCSRWPARCAYATWRMPATAKPSLRGQVLARLGRLIPYLAEHVVDVSQPLDTQSWDDLPARSDSSP